MMIAKNFRTVIGEYGFCVVTIGLKYHINIAELFIVIIR